MVALASRLQKAKPEKALALYPKLSRRGELFWLFLADLTDAFLTDAFLTDALPRDHRHAEWEQPECKPTELAAFDDANQEPKRKEAHKKGDNSSQ